MQQAHAEESDSWPTYANPFGQFFQKISDLDGNLIIDTDGNGPGGINIDEFRRGIIIETWYPPGGGITNVNLMHIDDGYYQSAQAPNVPDPLGNFYYEVREWYDYEYGAMRRCYVYVRQVLTNITNVQINTQYKYRWTVLYANGNQYWDPRFTTYLYLNVTPGNGNGPEDDGLNPGSIDNNIFGSRVIGENNASNKTSTIIDPNGTSGTIFTSSQFGTPDGIIGVPGASNSTGEFASGKLFAVKGAPVDESPNPSEVSQAAVAKFELLDLPFLYTALSVVLAACLPAGLLIRFVMFKRKIN